MTSNHLYQREIERQALRKTPRDQLAAHRWYLKRQLEEVPTETVFADGFTLTHDVNPATSIYRALYDGVGGPWLWADRRRLDDKALAELIGGDHVEIHVLRRDQQIAGFCELNFATLPIADLAYFGLMPAYTGRKLGPALLRFAINRAIERNCTALTLNTCSLDHPYALASYMRAGFTIIREEDYFYPDPRLDGTIAEDAVAHTKPNKRP